MGSYLLGMSPYIGAQLNGGNTPINTKGLSLGWMFAFLFVVSFVGLFSIVPLRKVGSNKTPTLFCTFMFIDPNLIALC